MPGFQTIFKQLLPNNIGVMVFSLLVFGSGIIVTICVKKGVNQLKSQALEEVDK